MKVLSEKEQVSSCKSRVLRNKNRVSVKKVEYRVIKVEYRIIKLATTTMVQRGHGHQDQISSQPFPYNISMQISLKLKHRFGRMCVNG